MSEINGFGDEENYGEVFPGWYLVRLTNKVTKTPYIVNGHEMKEGSWGLTWENDPSFVFDLDPMTDFDEEADADIINAAKNYSELFPKGYLKMFNHYNSRLKANISISYLLVKAAIEQGWDEEDGGVNYYIVNQMFKFLEECNWTPKRVSKYNTKCESEDT